MRKNNKKFISFLTIFTILFLSISFAIKGIESYADEYKSTKTYTVSALTSKTSKPSTRKSTIKVNSNSYSNKSKLPSSGSFNSGGSTNNNSTTIKPDSGSFTTKPNGSSNQDNNSTTIKPDSGNFTTKPSGDNSSSGSGNSNSSGNYKEYGDYDSGQGSYSGGGFFGGYFNPFRSFGYGSWHVSSWIINIVVFITVIIVAFIVIDYIRSKRK